MMVYKGGNMWIVSFRSYNMYKIRSSFWDRIIVFKNTLNAILCRIVS